MRKIAVILLALLVMGQIALAERFEGTYDGAKAQSAKLGKPILIDFFTDW